MSEYRDCLNRIQNLREYIKKLEDIRDILEDLPEIDDRAYDYYGETVNSLITEQNRIKKLLNRFEKVVGTYGNND